jgi:hypothetical protein
VADLDIERIARIEAEHQSGDKNKSWMAGLRRP